ncbi:unnamed protein product [Durusdinium trenchii]|uniref:EF-hand domain-containing protein n=1 Tax=Durusdinium trenchii TaxID=1381693 RepID=A0ABP0STP8_9DINO
MTMLTMLRILRILRMTRLMRAVRFMNIFRELRVMVQSVLGCLIPLFWCIVLLFFIQWCFAIYFITVTADTVQAKFGFVSTIFVVSWPRLENEITDKFGSLWKTLYVLFLSIAGGLDWGAAADLFIRTENYIAVLAFLFYVALVAMAVLNVDAVAVFQEADADDSGSITFEEFTNHLEDVRVQAFLRSMGLDGVEAVRLFKLLDADCNGEIEINEFVSGCMVLRGGAKTLDLAMLLMEQQKAMTRWMSFMSYVELRLNEISRVQKWLSFAGSHASLTQT